jgi:hypothetical protein
MIAQLPMPGQPESAGFMRSKIGPAPSHDQKVQRLQEAIITALQGSGGVAPEGAGVARAAEGTDLSIPEQKVGMALHKAVERGGTTHEEVVGKLRDHPDRPAFHAGGDAFVPYAKAVHRTPGPGREPIRQAIVRHARTAYDKMKGHIGEALGGKGDYHATLSAQLDARRIAARTGMEKIGDKGVVLDEHSVQALQSDLAKGAIKREADNLLASADPKERATGKYLAGLADQVKAAPDKAAVMTVEQSQNVSRTLLDAAHDAYRSGDGSRGKALQGLGRAIRDNASDPERGGHPEYRQWLQRYGHDSENNEALETGRNALKDGIDNTSEAIQKKLDGMRSPTAADHYRKGLGEALLHKVRSVGDVQAMRALLKSEDFRDKVKIAYPDEASYRKFEEQIEERVAEAGRTNRVTTGSDTAENLAAADDLNAQGKGNREKLKGAADAIRHPVRAVAGAALDKLADMLPADQGLLKDPETHGILGKALSDPKEMERLLNGSTPEQMRKEPLINPASAWGGGSLANPGEPNKPLVAGAAAVAGSQAPSDTSAKPAGGGVQTPPANPFDAIDPKGSDKAAQSAPDAQPPAGAAADPSAAADTPQTDYDSLLKEYAPGASPIASDISPTADTPAPVQDLLLKVRNAERSGDNAVSSAGAYGRYQITRATAQTYGVDYNRLNDPAYAKEAATRILTHLNDRYDGDIAAVLVAYNAGPGRADRWLASRKDPAVLPAETRNYLIRSGLADDAGSDYDALLREYGKVA